MKKAIFILCGCAAVCAGAAGVVLPIVPTTPFLLLAAACFLRGSDTLYQRLIHHPAFGHRILAYRRWHAISLKTKCFSIAFLWTSILYAAWGVVSQMWLRVALMLIAAGVTAHLLLLKTLTREMAEEIKEVLKTSRQSMKS
jgi:uncharacterized membrane protein YbaN (DUF454 family)